MFQTGNAESVLMCQIKCANWSRIKITITCVVMGHFIPFPILLQKFNLKSAITILNAQYIIISNAENI